jgi:hypothetical protein
MGGFGSGRPAAHATCEASLKLDLAAPAVREALHPRLNTAGCWAWSVNGQEIGAISYCWRQGAAELLLNYTCNGTPVSQTVTLVRSQPHFGGARWWFLCPATHQRVRTLFLPPGAQRFASRRAYRLRYQSQRESGEGRALLRLIARSGGSRHEAWLQEVQRSSDPWGFREEARWRRRDEARDRRNAVRRIICRQRRV